MKIENFPIREVDARKKLSLIHLSETERFFDAILEEAFALKWFSIFGLMSSLGLRACEIVRLNRRDIILKLELIHLHRKGDKERDKPLPSLLCFILNLYLNSTSGNLDDPLFLSISGNRITTKSLVYYFHKFKRMAGLPETIGATHFFRHLLFSELSFKKEQLDKIQNLADHESLRVTSRYLHVRHADVRQNFLRKIKPVGSDIYTDH